jgi:uncharacterized metal-binding protein YceD (DUF177 family)
VFKGPCGKSLHKRIAGALLKVNKIFMPVLVDLRQLKKGPLHLKGEMPITELDFGDTDDCVRLKFPLKYDLEAEMLQGSLLVQGSMQIILECSCVRCLKRHDQRVELNHWACQLGSEGEEKMVVVNDCVDLTPYMREDILLAFPQHPLCEPGCPGLPQTNQGGPESTLSPKPTEAPASPWDILDKLKL